MNVSSEHLRDEFKAHIEKRGAIQDKNLNKTLIATMEKWGQKVELILFYTRKANRIKNYQR